MTNNLKPNHRFTIEVHLHGWLIFAPEFQTGVPIDAMQILADNFQKGALDSGIAQALGAVMAAGNKSDLKKWRQEITQIIEAMPISKDRKWIMGVDCGLSSMALFWWCTKDSTAKAEATHKLRLNWDEKPTEYPRDGGDFGRCLRMVQYCGFGDKLQNARLISPTWATIIDRWESLTNLYKEGKLGIIEFPNENP